MQRDASLRRLGADSTFFQYELEMVKKATFVAPIPACRADLPGINIKVAHKELALPAAGDFGTTTLGTAGPPRAHGSQPQIITLCGEGFEPGNTDRAAQNASQGN